MLSLPLYLDYNATTPCDERVVEAMLPYFSRKPGNAASHNHAFGWEAKEAVEYAREQVAELIGAEPHEIIFTSGATEGDNLSLKGVFEAYAAKGNHIITCVTEHKAVLDACRHIEKKGGRVTYLEVNAEGLIAAGEIEAAITPATVLIALMYANNETGVIQPVREISSLARRRGILFMSDATQAVGKITVDVNKDGIDLLAFSAHKIYGPKGVGALFVRRKNPRVRLTAQMDGGGHEKGLRSGTLNVPGIVGMGKAAVICRSEMKEEGERLQRLRNKLEKGLMELSAVKVNGSRQSRLPHVTNLGFKQVDGNNLLSAITKQIAASSGSACTSALPEPSYVLKAMGLDDAVARASLRFSLGRFTTEEEIDYSIKFVSDTVNSLRKENIHQFTQKTKV